MAVQRRRPQNLILLSLVLIVVAFGVAYAWDARREADRAERLDAQLRSIESGDLASEKTRAELAQLRADNERRLDFWANLIGGLGPAVTVVLALSGGLLGLNKYLDARDQERDDRAAELFKELLGQVASIEIRQRSAGIAGLGHFLRPEASEYHVRALSALISSARMETEPEMRVAIRIGVEQAARALPASILRQVPWRGVDLQGVDLHGCGLQGLDLRDARLEDADLRGTNLSGALLRAARLNGARISDAVLRDADLTYADLAGASLVDADLRGALLDHLKVVNLDIAGADLSGAAFELSTIPWEKVTGWREATLDASVRRTLDELLGPEPSGPRVLMLMWEIAPLVAGGTWTAAYHLVRALRREGAHVAVVVPWTQDALRAEPFGHEVEVIALGLEPPAERWSPYSSPAWSIYAHLRPPVPESQSFASPYTPMYPYGAYGRHSTYGRSGDVRGSTLLRLRDEFTRRAKALATRLDFDVVHAHDWVTFRAAQALSEATGRPWVAHFHSTERERRSEDPDPIIHEIESGAVASADAVVVPSDVTKRALVAAYTEPKRTLVVPNPISVETIDPANMGRFESRSVVFVGRLSAQKGPDLLADIARGTRAIDETISFSAYGAGEEWSALRGSPDVRLMGPLEWNERSEAYRGASAVLMPSRREPFGMVVLEAMLHRVPVLYPRTSGAAERLHSGTLIDPEAIDEVAREIVVLLADWQRWEAIVEEQWSDVVRYADERPHLELQKLWSDLTGQRAGADRGGGHAERDMT
jgi:glycosyltransferase involved in cell wall biosynthesis